jgi:hypothetical protein
LRTDRCSNTIRYECITRRVRKEITIQKCKYRNSANVEHETFCHTSFIGATGIVTRGLKNYLATVPGKHSTDSLQRAAVPETSHITRNILQRET